MNSWVFLCYNLQLLTAAGKWESFGNRQTEEEAVAACRELAESYKDTFRAVKGHSWTGYPPDHYPPTEVVCEVKGNPEKGGYFDLPPGFDPSELSDFICT